MKVLTVIPHIGIGPLKLGISPQQILAAIDEVQKNYDLPTRGKLQVSEEDDDGEIFLRYCSDTFFFMVRYRNNQAIEVDVDYLISDYLLVSLYERNVFKVEAEELINMLKKRSSCSLDFFDEQQSTNFEFPDIGIRLWREYAFDKKLLFDKAFVEEMSMDDNEIYQYLHFQIIGVQHPSALCNHKLL